MRRYLLIAIAVAVALFAFMPGTVFAEEYIDPHWTESPIHFTAGIKFGMAFPTDEVMKEVYGNEGVPYYGMEAGWKMIHQLELHGEMAYWWVDGHGLSSDGKKTAERYKLHQAPVELGLVYRFNFMYDQIAVPYIGGGGVYSYYMEERLESGWKTKGAKWGACGKGGLMLLLDNAEKRASGALERAWGINNTYLVYNFKYTYLNDFDKEKGIDLSNYQHTLGVLFEF